MRKRSSRKQGPEDVNERAYRVFQDAVGENPPDQHSEKDPAAIVLGRKGGMKGGKARAAKLTPEQRSEIVRKAAKARWSNRK